MYSEARRFRNKVRSKSRRCEADKREMYCCRSQCSLIGPRDISNFPQTSYIKQSKTLGALREEHADLKERYVTLKATLDNSKAKVHEQAITMHDLSAAKAESDEKIANQKKKIEALQANHIASCTQIADLRAKQAISHKTITEMKEEIGELQSEEERHRQDRIRHAMDTCRPLYEMRRRKLKSQGLSEAEAQQKAEEFYCVEFKRHL